ADSASGSRPAPAAESACSLSVATVPCKRRFFMPGLALGFAELALIGYPLWQAFDLCELGTDTLLRVGLPVGVAAVVVWFAAITAWLLPLWQAGSARRRGARVNKEAAAEAYRIHVKAPGRVRPLRPALGAAAAGSAGVF